MKVCVGFGLVFTVVVAGKSVPDLGGVLAVFPALGLANQVLLWRSLTGGPRLVRQTTKSMAIGGTGVFTYALLFGVLLPVLNNVWKAAAAALAGSLLLVTIPLFVATTRVQKEA